MPPSTPQDLHIATPHGRLFAQRWHAGGDAAPIVLLHDSLGCVELWRDFPAALAAATARDVVAYDRLGFGRSDPHPGRLDAGFIAAEAGAGFAHVREAFALEHFVAFGHSVGGGMAVGCAARYPAQCRALVTESAQAFVEDRTRDGILAARAAFAEPGQVERLGKYHGDKAAWVLSAWIDTWLAPAFADWNLDAQLAGVHCPTLAVHGERDEYGSVRHPERIAAGVRGPATLSVLPGCGHVPHRERAGETLDLIAAWLRTVD
ncbi:alpha/beta fold hydrolase [Lysobacter enzymogenes]|uniref:alpha/beta fold hydrolase n=1 Tax=Lysobacter enzymogenes TaxID=69 RepID=UPI001A957CBE|nr:alpha/beta hydrolase [Lysobacter enzymogenes]QQP94964.1 alpha/beta hydrolase [Lysobacter enzymogenes]